MDYSDALAATGDFDAARKALDRASDIGTTYLKLRYSAPKRE
jgi:soluble cytochrome b562